MAKRWRVEVWWPGHERSIESSIKPAEVDISDGGVLRMLDEQGEVLAIYGPGFWVSADQVEVD